MAKTNTSNTKERETIKISSIAIPEKNVRDVKGTIFFTMTINGVTIYNCKVVSGKNGKFISFPQTKGKDDKYWSIVYVSLSDSDSNKIISKVETILKENTKTATPADDGEELPFM